MAPNPRVVGAPSYGALPGRMRCGPYRGEVTNLEEVPSRHGAVQRLTFAYNGGVAETQCPRSPKRNPEKANDEKVILDESVIGDFFPFPFYV